MVAAVIVLLAACNPAPEVHTGDTFTQYTVGSPASYSWAPTLEQVLLGCDEGGFRVEAYARGGTTFVELDILTSGGGAHEAHLLTHTVRSSMEVWEYLEVSVAVDGNAPSDARTDFTCTDPSADPPSLTFALRARSPYLSEDHEPHCIAWGHDPEGLRDGAYDDEVAFEAPEELRNCDIGLPPLMVSP